VSNSKGRSLIRRLVALDSYILNASIEDIYNGSDPGFVYKWQYKQLGGFDQKLASIISHADGGNIIKLYKGFPDQVVAMRAFSIKTGFWPFIEDRTHEVEDHLRLLIDQVNA